MRARGPSTRRCTGLAGAGQGWSASGWPGRSGASGCCFRGSNLGGDGRAAPPRVIRLGDGEAEARLAQLTGAGSEPAKVSAPSPPPPPTPSPRATAATRPTCCWPKPARASARRSAISPPPRFGRKRRAGRCGCRPIPRRCSASSMRKANGSSPTRPSARNASWCARGAKITCACSISRTRFRAVSRAGRRCWRNWSGAGRPTARTVTWSAATCRAGCRACSAAPAPPH